jgi:hypothetical protein
MSTTPRLFPDPPAIEANRMPFGIVPPAGQAEARRNLFESAEK